ncbi:hypothetical protein D9M68_454910 [compost metagenome]
MPRTSRKTLTATTSISWLTAQPAAGQRTKSPSAAPFPRLIGRERSASPLASRAKLTAAV